MNKLVIIDSENYSNYEEALADGTVYSCIIDVEISDHRGIGDIVDAALLAAKVYGKPEPLIYLIDEAESAKPVDLVAKIFG